MPAVQSNLAIEQGSDYAHAWGSSETVGVKVNGVAIGTGWTARGQVRARVQDAAVLYDLAPTVDAQGFVRVTITAATSSAWTWRTGVYDIEILGPGGAVLRVAQGNVSVNAEVTRA